MQKLQNEEFDLVLLLKTIWHGKWKIVGITMITFFAGILYIILMPNSVKISTKIFKNYQEIYVKYKTVNEILRNTLERSDDFDFNDEKNRYVVDADHLFKMFLKELNDYEEVMTVLSQDDRIKKIIKNLSKNQKQDEIIEFAKDFKINRPSPDEDTFNVEFIWHDKDRGIFLLNKIFDLVLRNVKNNLINDINSLALSIDKNNQRNIDSLNSELSLIREINELETIKRKRYLIEQSKIAKELGIQNNKLNNVALLNLSNPKTNDNIINNPYYLRGFKAIDKEIELIENRSKNQKDLMSYGFLKIKKSLINIKKNSYSEELRNAAKDINDDDIASWVFYNLELSDIQDLKKSKLYLFLSIVVGLIMGTTYVLITENFNKKS